MLALEIVKAILDSDQDFYYEISCEGEVFQPHTRDLSLLCNQKEGDEYVGLDNTDGAFINIYKCGSHYGYINWVNCAGEDEEEKLFDWTVNLDPFIKPILKKSLEPHFKWVVEAYTKRRGK